MTPRLPPSSLPLPSLLFLIVVVVVVVLSTTFAFIVNRVLHARVGCHPPSPAPCHAPAPPRFELDLKFIHKTSDFAVVWQVYSAAH